MLGPTEEDLFYNEYFELLINRVTHSTMSLEKDLGNPDDSKNAIRLKDNIKAFEYLLENLNKPFSEQIIIKVANLINNSSIYISDGYRNYGEYIADSNIPLSKPKDIRNDLLKLINNYYHNWNDMDPFEREAKFHIDFIRIHPFEDGNGRTARLLLNFNLLSQNLPPVIITDNLDNDYKSYIRDKNIQGMANMFRIQSQKEKEVFDKLYEQYTSKEPEQLNTNSIKK